MTFNPTPADSRLYQQLPDGLVLRQAVPQDAAALSAFNARVHSDHGPEQPDEFVAAWTGDLMDGRHPTCSAGDFTLVEDPQRGEIVSSMNLISQTWSYAGIPFKVGRPELVGTHADYRNRGLVRRQFEVIHQWSAARGELVQAITGIPYYYRQFGYEMALNLGGGRMGYSPHLPRLEEGQAEPFLIRPAGEADLAFIAEVYAHGCRRSLVACLRDEAEWRHELSGHSERSVNRSALAIIETPQGERLGFLATPRMLWGANIAVNRYELKPGASWLEVTPSVIRYLQAVGQEYARRDQKDAPGAFQLNLGEVHPAYEAYAKKLPRIYPPYAWYLRVPDLPALLQRISPVLEQRLADSIAEGFSGELRLSFYRRGLRLAFERGRIAAIENWQPAPVGHEGDALFPDLSFLRLVFGHLSADALDQRQPDCLIRSDQARVLLNALFPPQPSDVWPIS